MKKERPERDFLVAQSYNFAQFSTPLEDLATQHTVQNNQQPLDPGRLKLSGDMDSHRLGGLRLESAAASSDASFGTIYKRYRKPGIQTASTKPHPGGEVDNFDFVERDPVGRNLDRLRRVLYRTVETRQSQDWTDFLPKETRLVLDIYSCAWTFSDEHQGSRSTTASSTPDFSFLQPSAGRAAEPGSPRPVRQRPPSEQNKIARSHSGFSTMMMLQRLDLHKSRMHETKNSLSARQRSQRILSVCSIGKPSCLMEDLRCVRGSSRCTGEKIRFNTNNTRCNTSSLRCSREIPSSNRENINCCMKKISFSEANKTLHRISEKAKSPYLNVKSVRFKGL